MLHSEREKNTAQGAINKEVEKMEPIINDLAKVVNGVFSYLGTWEKEIDDIGETPNENYRDARYKGMMLSRLKVVEAKVHEWYDTRKYYEDRSKSPQSYMEKLADIGIELADGLYSLSGVHDNGEGEEKIDRLANMLIKWVLKNLNHFEHLYEDELIEKYSEPFIAKLKAEKDIN